VLTRLVYRCVAVGHALVMLCWSMLVTSHFQEKPTDTC
jgi:hypothetical protein